MAPTALSMLLGFLLVAGAQPPLTKNAPSSNTVGTVVVTAPRHKWTTDAPLRVGMVGLQNAVVAEYFAACAKGPTRLEYDRLAEHVDDQAVEMTKSQISGTPRAQLVKLVQEMNDSSALLKGSENPQSGVRKTLGVLISYATDFNHPGWRPRHRVRINSAALDPATDVQNVNSTAQGVQARAARLTLCRHLALRDFALWSR